MKGVTKTTKNETKEQKGGFLSMLLGTLGASLLGNILAGKGIVRAGSGCRSLNSYKKVLRAGYGKELVMENNGIFNVASSFNKLWNTKVSWEGTFGVFARDNLPLKKGWGIRNKPWWICGCRHTLDCFIL